VRSRGALVLLNGELRDPGAARAAARGRLVLCADGGARHAIRLGLIPDLVAGDMDSLPRGLPSSWKGVVFAEDRDPERSDLDKVLDAASALGARELLLAGALGGGLDHEWTNLAVLERRAEEFEISVIDRGTARLLGPGPHRARLARGARFSLLAAPRATLTLSGARWPLRRASLRRGSRGLGNAASGAVSLRVHSGRVWLLVDGPA
jgi:thiamine pyrophosphokinase